MNISLFRKIVSVGIKQILFFLIVFIVGRFIFLYSYADGSDLLENKFGLFKGFLVGFRFDTSVILYGFLPLLLFWIIALFIPKKKTDWFLKFYHLLSKIYLIIPLIFFLSFILIDYFFYRMFQTRIDVVFFGIIYDDTTAVLSSVWTDYPIIKIILIFIVTIFAFFWFYKKFIYDRNSNLTKRKTDWLFLLIIPLYFLGMRGSIGLFPLQREHTSVSNSPFINAFCYNPLYSLKFAYKEFKQNEIKPDLNRVLSINGFSSIEEAKEYFRNGDANIFDENLMVKTAKNETLEEQPPNIIFIQMESWSEHYFSLNSKEFNLIGELSNSLDELFYFKNALSCSNGTIYSLESLIIGTPHHIIAQSPFYNVPFSTSITRPFNENNYNSTFVTGGQISWRNIDNFLSHQGFDYLYDVNSITEQIPNTETFVWGAHDEYLFNFIEKYLTENKKQPNFIYAMTISNHSPFKIPKNYSPYPISVPDSLKSTFMVDEKLAMDNFLMHQYSSTEFARFIKRIKASPFGENTIIVATGDHNTRMVIPYKDGNSFLEKAVPIVMYIPEKYQPKWHNTEMIVSHKDIFPTLFNLSLSDTDYFYTGDNFFDSTVQHRTAVNGYDYIADSIGVILEQGRTPHYFVWKNKQQRALERGNNEDKHKDLLYKRLKAYRTMLMYRIFEEIIENGE